MSVPALRFKNDVGQDYPAWDAKQLGNIATFSKGKGISKADIDANGVTYCIRYGELYTVYGETIFDVKSKTNVDIKNLVLSEVNDVIIPASGETQIDIATASCVQVSGVALGGDLNIIKSQENGVFLTYYLNSKKKLDIAKLAQGNSVVHLYSSQLKLLDLKLPIKVEQTKIANFLTAVDEKITQLTQKNDLLTQYKKGVMQQIFSQELRFKDDDGQDFPEWEKKTLGEIGVFQTSSIDKLSKENETEVFLVNYMNVYRHENLNGESIKSFQVVTAKSSQIESCNLKKGDILFTPSSETPDDIGHSVVIFEDLENAVFSYHLMRFRPKQKIDILYSHYFCNIPSVLSQLTKLATGSTRFTISVKSFSSIALSLPCLVEQTKIAHFLKAIDDKITATQTQLQAVKQYILQQMFV
jgi:type I restriction enzyme S subunit